MNFDQDGRSAYYPVYYLCKKADTLYLGHQPISMFANVELDHKHASARNWNSTTDMSIDIFVDTAINMGHDIIYYHYSDDHEKKTIDSAQSIKSFPVFITNLSDSLITIGTHNLVDFLTREVQDTNGNWIEVEHRQTDLCGTAKRRLILEPGDIIVAKLLRCKGRTKAPNRLKFSIKLSNANTYTTYSNVYEDFFPTND